MLIIKLHYYMYFLKEYKNNNLPFHMLMYNLNTFIHFNLFFFSIAKSETSDLSVSPKFRLLQSTRSRPHE